MRPAALAGSRLRPLLGAVLLWQLFETCAYALVALPALQATLASGIAQFPAPAEQLFGGGGLWLLELLYQQRASLLASLVPGIWLFALVVGAGIVPQWWLLRNIVGSRAGVARAAAPELARLGLLELGVWLLRALTLLACSGLGWLAARLLAPARERLPDLLLLAGVALGLLLQLVLSVLRDLAALSVVRGERSLLAALRLSGHQLASDSLRLATRYGLYRSLALSGWLAGELLLFALPGAGLAHAGVGFAVHQTTLFLRLALRTLWLDGLERER